MLGYLSADIICTDNVQGQISEHVFAPNGGYCVYCPSNMFRNTRSLRNWGMFSDKDVVQLRINLLGKDGDHWRRRIEMLRKLLRRVKGSTKYHLLKWRRSVIKIRFFISIPIQSYSHKKGQPRSQGLFPIVLPFYRLALQISVKADNNIL